LKTAPEIPELVGKFINDFEWIFLINSARYSADIIAYFLASSFCFSFFSFFAYFFFSYISSVII